MQVARLSHQGAKIGGKVASQTLVTTKTFELNRFHQAAKDLSSTGKNNIRILRGWAKSKGWEKLPTNGRPEKWGNSTNGIFEWNLRIKPEASYRSGLDVGSGIPRFDARIGSGGNQYINPFSGQIGEKEIGTHIPLDILY